MITLNIKYPTLVVLNSKFEYKFDKFDISSGTDVKAVQTLSIKSTNYFLSQYPATMYPPDTGFDSVRFIGLLNNVDCKSSSIEMNQDQLRSVFLTRQEKPMQSQILS
jgi:hypothetical protein